MINTVVLVWKATILFDILPSFFFLVTQSLSSLQSTESYSGQQCAEHSMLEEVWAALRVELEAHWDKVGISSMCHPILAEKKMYPQVLDALVGVRLKRMHEFIALEELRNNVCKSWKRHVDKKTSSDKFKCEPRETSAVRDWFGPSKI